jgi:hypothetical protein
MYQELAPDFNRALARLERILACGYAFPFGIESVDAFLRSASTARLFGRAVAYYIVR